MQVGRMTSQRTDDTLLAWERTQPDAITKDALWTLKCYREAMFLGGTVGDDAARLAQRADQMDARKQLLTSVGSIAANIAEGYGRLTAADRAKYLSYALGSAREAMTWYLFLRSKPDDGETLDRIERLARIRRMLIGLLKRS